LTVLVVEDDGATREFVERGLAAHGMQVDVAADLRTARRRLGSRAYDAIVLDVMLPDGEGFELLGGLRDAGDPTPVVFVSARGEVTDRLRGFELGGDDYLRKPFALAELVARVRAVTRGRVDASGDSVLRVGDLSLDLRRRRAERGGRPIELPRRQFDVLECFMRRPGLVVSRSMLVEAVWGHGFEARSNAIDSQIKNLRDRIDRGGPVALLHTVRGVGWVLEPRPTPADPDPPPRG
jgi:DNA-binding response OmpR family regulator